jgi:glycosyltransferase involved in cell wall biosynthesis
MDLSDSVTSADGPPLRILAVVEWYPPAYKAGGPIRSVHNLMQLLRAQTNHRLEVVCGDRDLGSDSPLEGIQRDTPLQQDGVVVTYRSSTSRKWWLDKLRGTEEAPGPDVVYLNSLFSVPFALHTLMAARALGIPVVLAPRGMVGDGALAIKSFKKRVFLRVARALGWFRKVRWHASTEVERGEILTHFPSARVHIALNVPLVQANAMALNIDGPMTWIMLGRVQQKKNLHFALEALQHLDLKGRRLRVDLVGPSEDEAYLQKLLGMSKSGLEVRHVGAVPPHELGPLWERSHALLMPTTHENFGHAVVEAWAHGRPVLLSDQTPWRGLSDAGLGWDLPLDQAAWVRGMEEALDWQGETWQMMSQACQDKHRSLVEDPKLVADNLALFEAPWQDV